MAEDRPPGRGPELETERLLLRQFEERDLDAYAEMLADPQFMRFLGKGGTRDRQETWRHIAFLRGHWQLRGFGMFAIEHRASGELLGHTGLLNPDGWPGVELGWALRPDSWGHGFATEAAGAALDWAFEELGLPEIISMMYLENQASVRVAERLGLRPRGRDEVFGIEVLVYGMKAEERAARSA